MKYQLGLVLSSILVSTLLVPNMAAANIYRCEDEGRIFYQQEPCPTGVEQKTLDGLSFPPAIAAGVDNSGAKNPAMASSSGTQNSTNKSEIVLHRSPDSHFYIDAFINGQSVHFLVDTGASLVAIPDSLIDKLGLERAEAVNVKAASGNVRAYMLKIKEIKMGNFSFNDVVGETLPGGQALLGMNLLSEFDITLKNDQMILKSKE